MLRVGLLALLVLCAASARGADIHVWHSMDGARGIRLFAFITLPHLYRSITIVVMIETIFLLSVFAEIFVTTAGGPGNASTTLPFLIYKTALLDYNVGWASAGGVIAIILANIVAFFLVRTISHNLDR